MKWLVFYVFNSMNYKYPENTDITAQIHWLLSIKIYY